jgi:hypothetical protein
VNKKTERFLKNKILLEGALCFHTFDYEGNRDEALFKKVLKGVKKVNDHPDYNGRISYKVGYSNLSFDLWVLLHKIKFTRELTYKKEYLTFISKAFGRNFESMNKYKQEDNFKKYILSKIFLTDILNAIKHAKEIHGFKYFIDNPDLSIHECIETILNECGVMIN